MIALRSPYFIIENESNLTKIDLDIRIYTGAQDSSVSSPQYSLSSDAISELVVVDISELCRDYIDSTFDGGYDCTAVYVNYQVTRYISGVAQTPDSVVQLEGVDAYVNFEEGANSSNSAYDTPMLMQSNKTIYSHVDEPFRIPVYQSKVDRVDFMSKGVVVATGSITDTSSSTNIIRYISIPDSGDSFKERVDGDLGLYDDGTITVKSTSKGYGLYDVDRILVTNSQAGDDVFIDVITVHERRYDPVKVTFVNKFGALQDMWFFKINRATSNVESKSFRRNIISSGAYSTTAHSDYSLRRNSKESVELNSGLYSEDYSEVFRQLLLSESVWIKYEGTTVPVTVTNSSHTYQNSVNDKKIEFSLNVEFASNKINDIR